MYVRESKSPKNLDNYQGTIKDFLLKLHNFERFTYIFNFRMWLIQSADFEMLLILND